MDPVAHTLTGTALAAAGLRRATPLATAALVIGANIPDLDVIAYAAGPIAALEHRRGWTHGVFAMALWPVIVAALLLAFDRWCRRRANPDAPPARAGPLLLVSSIAVVTHPFLDWLNNYGMRWLMPFDGTWYYGDALFIIDPWVWLLLGGVTFLAYSSNRWLMTGWAAFWLVASWIILTSPMVPLGACLIWLSGVAVLVMLRLLYTRLGRADAQTTTARFALCAAGCYMAVGLAANIPARAEVRAELTAQGVGPIDRVMIGPAPANPFAGTVIVSAGDVYHLGTWNWLSSPRFDGRERTLPRGLDTEEARAASSAPAVRQFFVWSRFPYAQIDPREGGGYVVRFRDARYTGFGTGLISGPDVVLDRDLRVVHAP